LPLIDIERSDVTEPTELVAETPERLKEIKTVSMPIAELADTPVSAKFKSAPPATISLFLRIILSAGLR